MARRPPTSNGTIVVENPNDGGSSMPPDPMAVLAALASHPQAGSMAKRFRHRNTLTTWAVTIVVALSGAAGSWFALKANVGENSRAVEIQTERQGDVERTIDDLRDRVGAVEDGLTDIQTSQSEIIGGLKELKKENVDKLEDDLKDARRELRRRRRSGDD